ncbi:toluene tolerance protein [Endozoicomonas sp. Mp262]|uniref:lipopolysaccharide kinase InaA family protein n=1 Tax=Endozoicomonas sp. Mp262 TaxID=2919499 RepID=UPI0021D89784
MRKLTEDQYEALMTNARVIERDTFGPKVLRLADESFLKIFRRRNMLSWSLIRPYSLKFAANAEKLKTMGIPTVEIQRIMNLPVPRKTAVQYTPLAGFTIRELFKKGQLTDNLIKRLGQFIHQLHQEGIYFRSLHFGNIVLTPEDQFGLIDIADMRFLGRPLRKAEVIRNFNHMKRYVKSDFESPEQFELLQEYYLNH